MATYHKLTLKKIAAANKPGRYPDGAGLYLQVTEGGAKSWLLRYERGGRERWMGLGPLHTYTLDDAREAAREARKLLRDGIDPLDARDQEREKRATAAALAAAKTLTFEQAANQYWDEHKGKWRNRKHAKQFLSTLRTYAYPTIGRLSVADIDTGLILAVLKPIWHAKTETASRVRGRIEAVLDWAAVHGYRQGDNPARWKGHLAEALPARGQIQKTSHHAALPFAELPAFLAELRTREGGAARALEFTILTAARTGEVIGACWNEVDLEKREWTIPAERMKGGREHRVPLSDRAIEILKALPSEDGSDHVFIGAPGRGLSSMAMAMVLKRMKRADLTVHGFRSTFRDWAAERTNFPNHVVEMALAHVVGDKVEAAYRRGDLIAKRRQLADAWGKYCTTAPMGETGAKVVSLRREGQ